MSVPLAKENQESAAASTLKFTIDRNTLLKSLSHVQSVVERRNTIPILSNILIQAENGQVKLTATDMDIDIIEGVEANIDTQGATTVSAVTFYDIVRKLPEGAQIELDNTENPEQLAVNAGRSKFSLATLPTTDFPALSGGDFPFSFAIPATSLCSLVDRTRFAISTEETRYYLNGIYLHATETNGVDVLRAVSTDGHRLARVEMPLPEGANDIPAVIIPRKAVLELRKLLEECEENITIQLSETRIRFSFNETVFTSKLIDGTFPDYQRVIPEGNDKAMETDCRSLAQVVDRVATISSDKSRAVKLSLSNGLLEISANSPDQGSAVEEIEVNFSSDPIEIGFNSRYLLDVIQQVDGDSIRFTLADASAPALIEDITDESALYVLMPMRV